MPWNVQFVWILLGRLSCSVKVVIKCVITAGHESGHVRCARAPDQEHATMLQKQYWRNCCWHANIAYMAVLKWCTRLTRLHMKRCASFAHSPAWLMTVIKHIVSMRWYSTWSLHIVIWYLEVAIVFQKGKCSTGPVLFVVGAVQTWHSWWQGPVKLLQTSESIFIVRGLFGSKKLRNTSNKNMK
jgi:hypothetical protein